MRAGASRLHLRERGFENPIIGPIAISKIRTAQQVASAYHGLDLRAQDLRGALAEFSGKCRDPRCFHYLSPADRETAFPVGQTGASGAVLLCEIAA